MSEKIHIKQKNKKNVYDIQGGDKKVMKKSTKKVINVAASAALLAGIAPVAGIVAPTAAHASGSFSVVNVPTLSTNSGTVSLGRTQVTIDQGTLGSVSGNTYRLTLTLPSGVSFPSNYDFSGLINGTSKFTTSGGNNVNVTVGATSSKSVVLNITGVNPSDDVSFYVNLNNITSTGPSTGDLNVTYSADPSSGLPTGNVKVATVVSSGQVALEASSTQSSSDNFTFTLKVTESVAQSLQSGNAIRLKLPSGFAWNGTQNGTFTLLYGNLSEGTQTANQVEYSVNGDTLTIARAASPAANPGLTYQASSFQKVFGFSVTDEDLAKAGDVTATVSGNNSVNVSNLVVGTYGTYGGGVTIASPTTIYAGQDQQKVGDITIQESVAGSFVSGRTVTLQLPEGAAWESQFEGQTSGISATIQTANGLTVPATAYTGTDGRTLRLTFSNGNDGSVINTSSKAGSITLKNVEVAVRPGYSGDLNLVVGGSQGLTGTVKAATVTPSISLTATNATYSTAIGDGDVATGDIVLKEAVAGALTRSNGSDGRVAIELPWGVTFDGTPTVTVTSGDLRVNNVSADVYQSSNNGRLAFTIQNESSTPSTITISNVKLRIDRSVPQGAIVAKVTGQAAAYTAYAIDGNTPPASWGSTYRYASQAEIATVGTAPAGTTDNSVKAVYTIGSTAYTVNGQTRTAEVAPYVENGRTYLPVRYVAEALGVSQANILFDKPTSVVTMIKGDRVVQLKLNTNQLTINGSTINMDVKSVTKSNRTVLPIAWVGKALDAVIQYDAAAKTITVNSK
ncbi:copper amine oxidase N-terminal domain-containing protein [Paenibacillus campi]|uniref:copper amine oxidase N-terminal domain-containing protein n=1 Tax=Paenibacillus campi TaxID=3106031 RepID=UPI002AFEF6F3|nr:copper amine oxidase N-terminal domain-containing protein [Paenibacillus sp. SGZ-1009]